MHERRKTTPASFRNLGYQGSFLASQGKATLDRNVSGKFLNLAEEGDSPKSENGKESLSRAASEQSVNSVCSDEVSDRQLETLMECSNEGSQAGSYREASLDEMIKENGENSGENDVEVELSNAGENNPHERGIDVAEPRRRNMENVKTLHLDYKQRLLVKQHMHAHRPSLPVLFPSSSPEKDAARFLALSEMQNQAMRKKGKKEAKKEKETKMTRSPSTSSSNESQSEERKSTFYDMEEAGEEKEKAPTPKSMRKTLKAALNSKSSKSKENQPDNPKRKIFNFSRSKTPKSTGMRRSKSDMLHPGLGEEADRQRKTSAANRRSLILDDDTQSLCSVASLDDLTLRESHSENSLKEKASPKSKKGRTATLRLQKGSKDNERKKRAGSQTLHRDEGRVSMRAFLPNRAPLKILNIMKHWVSKHNQVRFLSLRVIFSEDFSDHSSHSNLLLAVLRIFATYDFSVLPTCSVIYLLSNFVNL